MSIKEINLSDSSDEINYKEELGGVLYVIGCKIISDDIKFHEKSNVIHGRLIKRLGSTLQSEEYTYQDFLEYAADYITNEGLGQSLDSMLNLLFSQNWKLILKEKYK